jgi:hypothetical protein
VSVFTFVTSYSVSEVVGEDAGGVGVADTGWVPLEVPQGRLDQIPIVD